MKREDELTINNYHIAATGHESKMGGSPGLKIVFVSILAIIQLALAITKEKNEGGGSWGAWFIPTWILLIFTFVYLIYHWFTKHQSPIGGAKRFLSNSWKFLTWIATLVFFIVLTIHLDQRNAMAGDNSIDGETLLLIWVGYFISLLILVLFYAIMSYSCRH